ncbi:MAG: M48 family metallopeptidase [Candidatus Vogelbacteria bacterium]|nr:M48 family metallopeptidase [Candidatus Vogelbacteria bacterium]
MLLTVIVIASLLLKFFLELIADLLNRRSLGWGLPEEFGDIIDAPTYQKSLAYTAAKIKLGIFRSAYALAILFVVWFLGGFWFLDGYLRGFNLSELATGLWFIGLIFFVNYLLLLPFRIYDTFVLEEKFGLNRTTAGTFVSDTLKSLALAILIGGSVTALVLYLFQVAGPDAWFYVWFSVSAVFLFLTYLVPRLILPLFNRFTPLGAGELKESITALARTAGFPLGGIFVIDGSRRSSRANAFFVGLGKLKRIALYDTLIVQQTVPELTAVLAHEIGHYKKWHAWRHLAAVIIQFGLTFFLFSFLANGTALSLSFGLEQPSLYANLFFFFIAYTFLERLFKIANNVFSRSYEYEADAFAARLTGRPEALISGLKKLAKNNLSNLTPHPFYVFINYSHPPLLDRFAALRKNL